MEIKEIISLVVNDTNQAILTSVDKHLPKESSFDEFSDVYLSTCINMTVQCISKINVITPLDIRDTLRSIFYQMQSKLIGNPNIGKMH